ncbi:cysteine synthase [Mucilaginibacter lappiensis]|uniref:Cysteine synthase B n=2 Tax=Mucilaginibacter lappiensis TaxID=354630 RepID=A0ABR6PDL2_9SPHI|nr:cysteine synthase CysM [Mucilaginibacter lappiensis]MBB6107847.1 cysteine synthase B [Mucilaginibacter lappiensis]SIP95126.1 cysteine synthase [Mucilaginibacter lappiensis]
MRNVIQTIGNTPLVELTSFNLKPGVKIFAKLEGNNPAGSVKDRAALNMIRSAIERGELKKGDKLIEATSGNTGIALAMIASTFGLQMEIVLPANSTRERTLAIEAFGATFTLQEDMEASRRYAQKKADEEGYFLLNQFDNDDNYKSHIKSTAPEIWKDTNGKITHFISAMGTTGTIMGNSIFLKEQNPAIQAIGCQPGIGEAIPGIPRWSPEYMPKFFDPSKVDRIVDITEVDSTMRTRQMARNEGIFAGMSTGGALHVALQVADEIEEGVIVFIACDRGDRYLSSNLFGDVI